MEKKLVVAFGKTLTSKKGVLDEGTPVDENFFAKGEETIKELEEKGYLTTYGEYKKILHLMGIKKATPEPQFRAIPAPSPEPPKPVEEPPKPVKEPPKPVKEPPKPVKEPVDEPPELKLGVTKRVKR